MKVFKVPNIYKSDLISSIKTKRKNEDRFKKDFSPTLLDLGSVQIFLARHFGFCYGVENAIEIAFNTIDENPGKKIYLLSEMIHNPQVNADLKERGIVFLQDTYGKQIIPFEEINGDDIVLIPAFGTTLEIEEKLRNKGIAVEKYNTTCPFVEKVWNRSQQVANKGYSIIIHGKPKHEETRATFSHAASFAPSVIVNDMEDAKLLAQYITKKKHKDSFESDFKNRFSPGFNVDTDLKRIGVVNQTTQLASETQAISDFIKQTISEYYNLSDLTVGDNFADTRDTLCYATNDNQTAVSAMLETTADLAIVIGGYNSSNTSHLVELCEKKLPTFFINSANDILDNKLIKTCNWSTKEVTTVEHFLPVKTPLKILITSGASCPDILVEEVIDKLASMFYLTEMLFSIKENWTSDI